MHQEYEPLKTSIMNDYEKTPLLQTRGDECPGHDEKTSNVQLNHQKTYVSIIIIISLTLSGVYMGVSTSIIGPALPDLALLTNSTIPQTSAIIVGTSATYILGSMIAGFLLEYIDGFFVVAVGFLLQAGCFTLAFSFSDLGVLTGLYSVAMFFGTIAMAGVAILCFTFPRRKAQIMVQIVFMMLNVGKTLSPFIVAPFISFDDVNTTSESSNMTSQGIPLPTSETHIYMAYMVVSIYAVVLSILNIIIFFLRGEKWFDKMGKPFSKQTQRKSQHMLGKYRQAFMLVLMSIMMAMMCGLENTEMALLTSYFSEYLHLAKMVGVTAAAVYQGLKLFFNLFVLILIRIIHPATMLFGDYMLVLFGTVSMTIAVWLTAPVSFLWASLAFISAGFSNYLATQVSWVEIRQPISGKLAPLFSLSTGLGGLFIPPIATSLLSAYGPLAYPLTFTVAVSICILLYFITKIVSKESFCPSTKGLYEVIEPDDVIIKNSIYSTNLIRENVDCDTTSETMSDSLSAAGSGKQNASK